MPAGVHWPIASLPLTPNHSEEFRGECGVHTNQYRVYTDQVLACLCICRSMYVPDPCLRIYVSLHVPDPVCTWVRYPCGAGSLWQQSLLLKCHLVCPVHRSFLLCSLETPFLQSQAFGPGGRAGTARGEGGAWCAQGLCKHGGSPCGPRAQARPCALLSGCLRFLIPVYVILR